MRFIKKLFDIKARRKVKHSMAYPYSTYRIVFKKGALKSIMKVKGWKSYQSVANALGFTRQYIQMLDKTKVAVTAEVISRVAVCTGSTTDNWWIHYELIPWGVENLNHPVWNMEKHNGKIPYVEHSISSEFRSLDYPAENIQKSI